jgi:hypothetical protein
VSIFFLSCKNFPEIIRDKIIDNYPNVKNVEISENYYSPYKYFALNITMNEGKNLVLVVPYNKLDNKYFIESIGNYIFRLNYIKWTYKVPNSGIETVLCNVAFEDFELETIYDAIINYDEIYNYLLQFSDHDQIPDVSFGNDFKNYIDENYNRINIKLKHKYYKYFEYYKYIKKYVISKDFKIQE